MKIVQIGTGGWGKNHCRVLSEFGVLSAICDMNYERAKEFGEKYNVNYYKTLEELFENEEFDAAFICTPTSTHSELALQLIEKKKHVFVEKPMTYLSEDGEKLVVETTTSWCFVGAGLRLSMELFGPEYSMFVNTLDSDLKVFFSRKVVGIEGEDLVEKQNAESGEMPVVSSETDAYGYTAENRHMVQRFLAGERPEENFSDGVAVTELLMTAYMSAEQDKTIQFPPPGLDDFVPAVAKGEWNPNQ
mgnify:CR=1 FL=1